MICSVLLVMTVCVSADCASSDNEPPKVVSTVPSQGALNVDPALKEITVTFNEPMRDKCWSWCYEDKKTFPEMNGQPCYRDSKHTTCVMPVKLEPGRNYVVWLNTGKNKSFMDNAGNPLQPYKLIFRTR